MRRYALATMLIGSEASTIGRYSLPLMRHYAERCGADLVLLEPSPLGERIGTYYEKCQIGGLLEHYERVLYLDADVLVSPDSPDVFVQVPQEQFGAVSVEAVFQKLSRSRRLTTALLGSVEWHVPYFNAGVMLASRAQRALFEADSSLLESWHSAAEAAGEGHFHDQDFFNHRLNLLGLPFYDMGQAFNFTRAWGGFHRRFDRYFIHYAGLKGARDALMARDASVLCSGWKRTLFGRLPWWVWLWDRVPRLPAGRDS